MNLVNIGKLALLGALVLVSHRAMGQESIAKEDKSFVVLIGPTVERNLNNNTFNRGGTAAVEFTPIEDVLEIEVNATLLNSTGQREWSSEILFKKPFRLSPTSELMVGIGPQVGRKLQGADRGPSTGIALALDLMFWETNEFGWYLGPEYGYGLGRSRGERTIGVSAGIVVGW